MGDVSLKMGKMGLFSSLPLPILSSSWKLVSHLPRELPLLVAVETAANGHLWKTVLRLEAVPLSCCGNLVTDSRRLPAPPLPFFQRGGVGVSRAGGRRGRVPVPLGLGRGAPEFHVGVGGGDLSTYLR